MPPATSQRALRHSNSMVSRDASAADCGSEPRVPKGRRALTKCNTASESRDASWRKALQGQPGRFEASPGVSQESPDLGMLQMQRSLSVTGRAGLGSFKERRSSSAARRADRAAQKASRDEERDGDNDDAGKPPLRRSKKGDESRKASKASKTPAPNRSPDDTAAIKDDAPAPSSNEQLPLSGRDNGAADQASPRETRGRRAAGPGGSSSQEDDSDGSPKARRDLLGGREQQAAAAAAAAAGAAKGAASKSRSAKRVGVEREGVPLTDASPPKVAASKRELKKQGSKRRIPVAVPIPESPLDEGGEEEAEKGQGGRGGRSSSSSGGSKRASRNSSAAAGAEEEPHLVPARTRSMLEDRKVVKEETPPRPRASWKEGRTADPNAGRPMEEGQVAQGRGVVTMARRAPKLVVARGVGANEDAPAGLQVHSGASIGLARQDKTNTTTNSSSKSKRGTRARASAAESSPCLALQGSDSSSSDDDVEEREEPEEGEGEGEGEEGRREADEEQRKGPHVERRRRAKGRVPSGDLIAAAQAICEGNGTVADDAVPLTPIVITVPGASSPLATSKGLLMLLADERAAGRAGGVEGRGAQAAGEVGVRPDSRGGRGSSAAGEMVVRPDSRGGRGSGTTGGGGVGSGRSVGSGADVSAGVTGGSLPLRPVSRDGSGPVPRQTVPRPGSRDGRQRAATDLRPGSRGGRAGEEGRPMSRDGREGGGAGSQEGRAGTEGRECRGQRVGERVGGITRASSYKGEQSGARREGRVSGERERELAQQAEREGSRPGSRGDGVTLPVRASRRVTNQSQQSQQGQQGGSPLHSPRFFLSKSSSHDSAPPGTTDVSSSNRTSLSGGMKQLRSKSMSKADRKGDRAKTEKQSGSGGLSPLPSPKRVQGSPECGPLTPSPHACTPVQLDSSGEIAPVAGSEERGGGAKGGVLWSKSMKEGKAGRFHLHVRIPSDVPSPYYDPRRSDAVVPPGQGAKTAVIVGTSQQQQQQQQQQAAGRPGVAGGHHHQQQHQQQQYQHPSGAAMSQAKLATYQGTAAQPLPIASPLMGAGAGPGFMPHQQGHGGPSGAGGGAAGAAGGIPFAQLRSVSMKERGGGYHAAELQALSLQERRQNHGAVLGGSQMYHPGMAVPGGAPGRPLNGQYHGLQPPPSMAGIPGGPYNGNAMQGGLEGDMYGGTPRQEDQRQLQQQFMQQQQQQLRPRGGMEMRGMNGTHGGGANPNVGNAGRMGGGMSGPGMTSAAYGAVTANNTTSSSHNTTGSGAFVPPQFKNLRVQLASSAAETPKGLSSPLVIPIMPAQGQHRQGNGAAPAHVPKAGQMNGQMKRQLSLNLRVHVPNPSAETPTAVGAPQAAAALPYGAGMGGQQQMRQQQMGQQQMGQQQMGQQQMGQQRHHPSHVMQHQQQQQQPYGAEYAANMSMPKMRSKSPPPGYAAGYATGGPHAMGTLNPAAYVSSHPAGLRPRSPSMNMADLYSPDSHPARLAAGGAGGGSMLAAIRSKVMPELPPLQIASKASSTPKPSPGGMIQVVQGRAGREQGRR